MPNEMSFFEYDNVKYEIEDEKARQALAQCVNNGYYDSNAKKIILRHDSDTIVQIDATDFIKDGMVSNVQIINGYLVITFNTDSGQEPISIPITDIFNPDNYYTKSATNELLSLKQNVIQDLAQIRQGAEAGATAYQKPQGGIPKTDMSDGVKESLDKADGAAPKTEVEDHYARKDGYYETLGAGTANNLKSDITTDREIMYDKSGGLNDIDSGSANLSKVQGNTIAWNQLVKNGNFDSGFDNWSVSGTGVYEVKNNIATISFTQNPTEDYSVYIIQRKNIIKGHKYCIFTSLKGSHSGKFKIDSNGAFATKVTNVNENTWTNTRFIATGENSVKYAPFMIYPRAINDGYVAGDSYSVSNIMFIDLTLIYGAGNEPTSVAQFEADYQRWFGKPLTYEPYDAGSFRNVMMSAIKTTGFNQWDEEWEEGGIDIATGQNISLANNLRSKNYCKCFGDTDYYFLAPNKEKYIFWYDTDKNYIRNGYYYDVFHSPSNAAYFRFREQAVIVEYNHDICINISDQSKNGTYEPYKKNIAALPITTLTGKLDGQGESVVIFPDGMKSAGNIHDEIFVDNGIVKAIKRVGVVDLGNLAWAVAQTSSFYSILSTLPYVDDNKKGNILCPNYITRTRSKILNYDKSICASVSAGTKYVNIYDTQYNSPSAFKTAMNGVMLYYELETPEVYVLDNDVLPLMYKVDEFGTEQVLPECTEETPCCAPILSVNYAMNAVAQLRNMHTNYISKASFDNFLNLVNSTLVSVLGGTISVNPTQTNDAYTFAFNEVSNMVVFVSDGSQITDVIGNFPQESYINNGKAKFYLRHDNALIPLSVAYTGSITAVGVYSPYGSSDTYTVRFSGAYSTSIIGATVNVEQIN